MSTEAMAGFRHHNRLRYVALCVYGTASTIACTGRARYVPIPSYSRGRYLQYHILAIFAMYQYHLLVMGEIYAMPSSSHG